MGDGWLYRGNYTLNVFMIVSISTGICQALNYSISQLYNFQDTATAEVDPMLWTALGHF
jgi:hypothetical protein